MFSAQKKQQKSISQFFTPKRHEKPEELPPSSPLAKEDSLFISEENAVVSRKENGQLDGGRKRSYDEHINGNSNGLNGESKKHKDNPPEREEPAIFANGTKQGPASQYFATEPNVTPERSESVNQPRTHNSKASSRTAKYVFSNSPTEVNQSEPTEPSESRHEKDKLHDKFVKKLGKPDSIAEIKRRNRFITEETQNENDAGEDIEDDDENASSSKGRGGGGKKGANKLTPMEKQILDIKAKHGDTLLVVEVGYKFRFFGEDARIAAKELGIVCIPGKYRYDEHPSEAHIDRFASASIPVHRLHVHVKRLVAAGHKVGVVRQLETAALKAAGDNRNAPFVRKLTNVYTKGTYIDDIESSEDRPAGPSGIMSTSGYLLCLTETNAKGWGNDEKVNIGIVAVQPATGDIIYDDFEDGFMRSEIETRLLHIAPCEFLLVGQLSRATEKLVQHLSGSKANVFGDKARVQRVDKPKTMAAESYHKVANFYADKLRYADPETEQTMNYILDKAHKLSEQVTICLSAMIKHLSEYDLQHVFDLTKNFQPFSSQSHMLLNGNTLASLEIYQNQTDYSEKGTLFWTMNRTKTKFGGRLMRKWVGRPLLAKQQLEERIEAVEELKSPDRAAERERLARTLKATNLDVEKSLIRIYYKRCSRPELLGALQCMQRIANEYANVATAEVVGFGSELLRSLLSALPKIGDYVVECLDKINSQAAKDDDKYTFFREEHESEVITEHKLGIASIESDLNEHLKNAAEKLRRRKVEYVTVAGIEYLIEVENTQLKNVPASWAKISGTKKLSRFHTPEVIRFIRARDQHREALAAACDALFMDLLAEIGSRHQEFRDCVQALATLDCLSSLAEVAEQPGYVKPEFVEHTQIEISQGRHPMVEQILLDSYVPNDVDLASDGTRAMLITGPNMGGKSSYVRQVALISIMAQIGSHVPAGMARLGLLDAVFTRMGASDNMMAGESTFMVELSETSDILKQATPRSLVILDELGRGTSTHDGVAIAEAVLDYIVREKRCLTMFITHYQSLARMASNYEEGVLKNVHMRFTESGEDGNEITFLYSIGDGVAHRSYGLNVARLANIPESVLELAAIKSKEFERSLMMKKMTSLTKQMSRFVEEKDDTCFDQIVAGIAQL